MTADGVATSGMTFHELRAVLHKDIVTSVACRAAHVFKDPPVVAWKDTGVTIPWDRNTDVMPPRATNPVWIGNGLFVSPIIIRSQEIEGPR